jgi:hypothetical protein
LFARRRTDAVAAPFLVGAHDVAAFAAARAAGRPRTVIVEHGDIAHDAPSWDLNLLAADALVVPTRELADHMRARAARYDRPTATVEVGSYRWPAYERLARARRRPVRLLLERADARRFRRDRPVLVYTATALAGDYRYLDNAWYPDAWHMQLQQAIVGALAEQDRFNAVVKLFPTEAHDRNPLDEHVRDLGADHLLISRAPFRHWLPWADRVFLDMASTALYETLVAGVAARSLLWAHHPARPGALEQLGSALAPFETPDEAAQVVRAFAQESAPAIPTLRPEGDDLLAVLTRIARSDGD